MEEIYAEGGNTQYKSLTLLVNDIPIEKVYQCIECKKLGALQSDFICGICLLTK